MDCRFSAANAAETAVDAFLLQTDPTRLPPLAQRLTGWDAQST